MVKRNGLVVELVVNILGPVDQKRHLVQQIASKQIHCYNNNNNNNNNTKKNTGEYVGFPCIPYSPSGNSGYNIDRTPCKTQIGRHTYYQSPGTCRYIDLVEDLVDVLPLFKTLKSKSRQRSGSGPIRKKFPFQIPWWEKA